MFVGWLSVEGTDIVHVFSSLLLYLFIAEFARSFFHVPPSTHIFVIILSDHGVYTSPSDSFVSLFWVYLPASFFLFHTFLIL